MGGCALGCVWVARWVVHFSPPGRLFEDVAQAFRSFSKVSERFEKLLKDLVCDASCAREDVHEGCSPGMCAKDQHNVKHTGCAEMRRGLRTSSGTSVLGCMQRRSSSYTSVLSRA